MDEMGELHGGCVAIAVRPTDAPFEESYITMMAGGCSATVLYDPVHL